MKKMVSCIILDYLKAKQVVQNVKSLLLQKGNFDLEIIVIDNSVDTENAEVLNKNLKNIPHLQLFIQKENIGYPRANNIGASLAKGEYIFFVNSDIFWKEEDSLQKMITYIENHSDVGILGPRQKNEDGTFAMNVRKFPNFFVQIARRTFLKRLPYICQKVEEDEMKSLDISKIQEVDWLQSSCFGMRKKFYEEVGGLNEEYFLFMSDAEICLKAWEKGKKVVFFAETEVEADGKRCSEGGFIDLFKKKILRTHFCDAWKYFWKHLGQKNPRYLYSKAKHKS